MHLKTVHSVTKKEIKHAQRIPMNGLDFLLVLAQDNVMCFTSAGCNTKLSCLSSAKRHYKQKHGQQPGSGESGISDEQVSGEQVDYSNQIFDPITGTFKIKKEPQVAEMSFISNVPGPSKQGSAAKKKRAPSKKIKTELGTSPKKAKIGATQKNPNVGPPPKILSGDSGTPSNVDINISQTGEGARCNVCDKKFSSMGNARRHYKTTHEVNYSS